MNREEALKIVKDKLKEKEINLIEDGFYFKVEDVAISINSISDYWSNKDYSVVAIRIVGNYGDFKKRIMKFNVIEGDYDSLKDKILEIVSKVKKEKEDKNEEIERDKKQIIELIEIFQELKPEQYYEGKIKTGDFYIEFSSSQENLFNIWGGFKDIKIDYKLYSLPKEKVIEIIRRFEELNKFIEDKR
jgi:hypothetical protein